MDKWIMFVVVWVVVELIQFLRKRPLPNRMKTAAGWAVTLTTLADMGQASRTLASATDGAYWIYFATVLAINAGVALVFYWFRVGLTKVMTPTRQT